MGRFATGVAVVTTRTGEGRPLGMTVNSLTSVSLDPPLLLVCIAHDAAMHPELVAAERFAINILDAHQEAISRRFAGPHDDRFDGVGYQVSDHGDVLLDGALAHIACMRDRVVAAGDHSIVFGHVTGGNAGDGRPLLYYRGGYHGIG